MTFSKCTTQTPALESVVRADGFGVDDSRNERPGFLPSDLWGKKPGKMYAVAIGSRHCRAGRVDGFGGDGSRNEGKNPLRSDLWRKGFDQIYAAANGAGHCPGSACNWPRALPAFLTEGG